MLSNIKTTFHKKTVCKIIRIKLIMKYYITGYSSKFVFQVLQSGYHISCNSFCFIWKNKKNVVILLEYKVIIELWNYSDCVVLLFVLLTRRIKCLRWKIIYSTWCEMIVRIVACSILFRLFKLVFPRRL